MKEDLKSKEAKYLWRSAIERHPNLGSFLLNPCENFLIRVQRYGRVSWWTWSSSKNIAGKPRCDPAWASSAMIVAAWGFAWGCESRGGVDWTTLTNDWDAKVGSRRLPATGRPAAIRSGREWRVELKNRVVSGERDNKNTI